MPGSEGPRWPHRHLLKGGMEEKRVGTSVFFQKGEEMSQTMTHGWDLAGQRVEKGGIPTHVAQTSSPAREQGPAKQPWAMAGNKKIG